MRIRLTVWAFVLILFAIPVLGIVQWRWIERVTDAEIQRESERLRSAIERVTSEFNAEVTRAHLHLAASPLQADTDELPRLLSEWNTRAPFPDIVREIYLVSPDEGLTVRVARTGVVQHESPPSFTGGRPIGEIGSDPALFMPMPVAGFGFLREGPPELRGPPEGFAGEPLAPGMQPPRVRIVRLDRDVLLQKLLPAVLRRHVDARQYRMAVRSSAARLTGPELTSPDAAGPLVAIRPDCLGLNQSRAGNRRGTPPPFRRGRPDMLALPAQICALPADEGLWRLEVQHSSGSLAHAMRSVKIQNLSLSYGVLALLTGAVIALWVSIQRARTLAQRQVEFAMSVSHELKTPLTVMRLAGDNLASGAVVTDEQRKRYGETIRAQSERLGNMVEQILTFARSQRPDWHVRTELARPEAILDAALTSAETVLRESRCEVQREAEEGLPDIDADANLMTSALTNLLVNAARYGASGGWIRARVFEESARVIFEIADRGPGIPARDIRRVFEPFYRGKNLSSSRGAGLGLHLVRRIVSAHNGSVSIDSTQGAGTTVRIDLPIASAKEEVASEATSADRRG